MPRNELTFLVSERVPNGSDGSRRSETFTSARILPCSMRACEMLSARTMSRIARMYAPAISGARSPAPSIGFVTISMSGTPARL